MSPKKFWDESNKQQMSHGKFEREFLPCDGQKEMTPELGGGKSLGHLVLRIGFFSREIKCFT